jgi:hypothetical protein
MYNLAINLMERFFESSKGSGLFDRFADETNQVLVRCVKLCHPPLTKKRNKTAVRLINERVIKGVRPKKNSAKTVPPTL